MRGIDRRGFLRLFGIGAAAIAVDPEILLWEPGAKTISIPAVRAATLDEINLVTLQYVPSLADILFKDSPFFVYMREQALKRGVPIVEVAL